MNMAIERRKTEAAKEVSLAFMMAGFALWKHATHRKQPVPPTQIKPITPLN